jgi:HTH-type transcriptional regulator/antitoxin HigA
MAERRAAEVFPPGDFIKEELEARDWSQADLAEIMGRSAKEVSDLVSGKRAISLGIAKELGAAFGTSAQYWVNLESSYQLGRGGSPDDAIARRAKLYQLGPIKEMIKRHWLEPSGNVAVLEQRVMRFFEISHLDQRIGLPHAARRGTQEISQAQWAWLYRARQLARAVEAKPYSAQSFERGLSELRNLLPNSQEVRRVPKILQEAGIRFLILEHLPKTRIDGVTFWLGAKMPVIALSLRYDRVDWFWYTLSHELGHVERRDAWKLDTDIVGEDVESVDDVAEREAHRFATEFLVKPSDLEDFILRVRPLYGRQKILGFANRIGVHPGIVVGQLQFHGEVQWSAHRQMLDKVRHIVIGSALTDGWGQVPPILN